MSNSFNGAEGLRRMAERLRVADYRSVGIDGFSLNKFTASHLKNPTRQSQRSSLYMIGRNSRGHWVVRDQSGLRGGYFIDRASALKFALFDDQRPRAVIMVPGVFELNLSASASSPEARQSPTLVPTSLADPS